MHPWDLAGAYYAHDVFRAILLQAKIFQLKDYLEEYNDIMQVMLKNEVNTVQINLFQFKIPCYTTLYTFQGGMYMLYRFCGRLVCFSKKQSKLL